MAIWMGTWKGIFGEEGNGDKNDHVLMEVGVDVKAAGKTGVGAKGAAGQLALLQRVLVNVRRGELQKA